MVFFFFLVLLNLQLGYDRMPWDLLVLYSDCWFLISFLVVILKISSFFWKRRKERRDLTYKVTCELLQLLVVSKVGNTVFFFFFKISNATYFLFETGKNEPYIKVFLSVANLWFLSPSSWPPPSLGATSLWLVCGHQKYTTCRTA